MRFRAIYTLRFLPKIPPELALPLEIVREEGKFKLEPRDHDEEFATAVLECDVNSTNLELRKGPDPLDGGEADQGIYVPESTALSRYLRKVIGLISFLVDSPIRHSHKLGEDILIPESREDELLLDGFATSRVFQPVIARMSVRSFSPSDLGGEEFDKLFTKELGLRLYHHALLAQDSLGEFREYWKVLESAFRAQDNELVGLLSQYEPAQQIGFTKQELSELLVLRGRASHAQSGAGIEEYRYVVGRTSRRLPRLKCLVEQVILTKRTWGVPTTAITRLAEVDAYIDPDDTPVLIQRK